MLLAAKCHLGSKNCLVQMEQYVHTRRDDGIHIINLGKTWEKLLLAARIIVAIENPEDVCVISARPLGQRAAHKFAHYVGCKAIASRFTPGSFTNFITRSFKEPRLIVVTDPYADYQAIREASLVSIPVIALCDTDSPMSCINVAIPTANKGKHAIGLMYWLLAREILRLRGSISRQEPWNVMVDMFFYRGSEDVETPKGQFEDKAQPDAATEAAAAESSWDAAATSTATAEWAAAEVTATTASGW